MPHLLLFIIFAGLPHSGVQCDNVRQSHVHHETLHASSFCGQHAIRVFLDDKEHPLGAFGHTLHLVVQQSPSERVL